MFGFLRWSFCLNSQNPGDRETGSSNVLNRYELFRYAPAPSVKGKTVQTAYCEGWSALCRPAVSKSALVDVWQIVGKWRLAAGRLSSLLHSPCKRQIMANFFKEQIFVLVYQCFFSVENSSAKCAMNLTFARSDSQVSYFEPPGQFLKQKQGSIEKNFICSSDFPFILNVSSKTSCCIW